MKEFYVGQDVVAIEDHPQGKFRENDTFVTQGLRSPKCGCDFLEINIGLPTMALFHLCSFCGSTQNSEENCYFASTRFRPLDELTNISELTEVLENSKPFEIIK